MAELTSVENTSLSEGFTKPGIEQFDKVVEAYAQELLKRTTLNAEAEKIDGSSREVTSTHVRRAARDIAAKPTTMPPSFWRISGHVSE